MTQQRQRRVRVLAPVVAAVAVLAGLLAPLAATAAPSPAPSPGTPPTTGIPNYDNRPGQQNFATWSLVPVGVNGKLDGRAKYAYTAAPGSTITDVMGVSNFSLGTLRLKIATSDAINTPEGAFGLLPVGAKSKDAGTWITPKRSVLDVPARSRVAVPFTLRVPANAEPGDHIAGITAVAVQSKTGNKTQQVAVNFRTGSRVYIRVTGALRPQLAVSNLKAKYQQNWNPVGAGVTTVTYRVTNTGNIRLGAQPQVSVSTLWGMKRTAAGLRPITDLLPGQSVDLSATVNGTYPAVLLKAKVQLQPVPPRGASSPSVPGASASTWFWAIPWALIALIAVLVVAWFVRRFTRRRAQQGGSGRHSGRTGAGPTGGDADAAQLELPETVDEGAAT